MPKRTKYRNASVKKAKSGNKSETAAGGATEEINPLKELLKIINKTTGSDGTKVIKNIKKLKLSELEALIDKPVLMAVDTSVEQGKIIECAFNWKDFQKEYTSSHMALRGIKIVETTFFCASLAIFNDAKIALHLMESFPEKNFNVLVEKNTVGDSPISLYPFAYCISKQHKQSFVEVASKMVKAGHVDLLATSFNSMLQAYKMELLYVQLAKSENCVLLKQMILDGYDFKTPFKINLREKLEKATPLMAFAYYGNLEGIKTLVEDGKVDINAGVTDSEGNTFDVMSCAAHFQNIAHYLFDKGYEPKKVKVAGNEISKVITIGDDEEYNGPFKHIFSAITQKRAKIKQFLEFFDQSSCNEETTVVEDVDSPDSSVSSFSSSSSSSSSSSNFTSASSPVMEEITSPVRTGEDEPVGEESFPGASMFSSCPLSSSPSTPNASDRMLKKVSGVLKAITSPFRPGSPSLEDKEVHQEIVDKANPPLSSAEKEEEEVEEESEVVSEVSNLSSCSVSEVESDVDLDYLLMRYFQAKKEATGDPKCQGVVDKIKSQIENLCATNDNANMQLISTLNEQYFKYAEAGDLVTQVIGNPQLVHKYFQGRDKALAGQQKKEEIAKKGSKENLIWEINGKAIKSSDIKSTKIKWGGSSVSICIDPNCKIQPGSGLDNLSRLSKDSLGKNGVKFRTEKGKIILKTKALGKDRLVATEMHQNEYGDYLLVFSKAENHRQVEKATGSDISVKSASTYSSTDDLSEFEDETSLTGDYDSDFY